MGGWQKPGSTGRRHGRRTQSGHAERRTQNANAERRTPRTWQQNTRPFQHPRPNTRSVFTSTGGGSKGGRPPWASNAERRTPGTWQRPTREPPHPRPSTRRAHHQHRRGVEGGSPPLGITAGGRRGVAPPGHQAERRTQNAQNLAAEHANRPHPRPSTRPALTSTGGGSKGGRPPWASRRGVEGGSSPLGVTGRPTVPRRRPCISRSTG